MVNSIKKYAIIILMFMVIGQIAEIKTQTVPLYDYIKQYAVVEVVTSGATYKKYCEDCTCTISITKRLGETLFNDRATTEISTGLYGYRTTPSEFNVNDRYGAKFYCTSPTYGNGTVYSQVQIISGEQTADISVNTDSTDQGEDFNYFDPSSWVGSLLNGLQAIFTFDLEDKIKNTSIPLIPQLWDFVKGFGSVVWSLVTMFIMLFTDPLNGWKLLISLLWSIFKPLLIVFSIPVIIYETYAVTTIFNKPLDKFIPEFLRLQILPFSLVFKLFTFVRETISNLYFMLTDSIKAIGSLIPFT